VIRPQVLDLDLDSIITAVADMLRRTIGDHVELVTSLGGRAALARAPEWHASVTASGASAWSSRVRKARMSAVS
jgi:hypothetical protein